jgi:hypothetical protein
VKRRGPRAARDDRSPLERRPGSIYGIVFGMRVRMLAIVQRMRFLWFELNWNMQASSE